ncbi:MAG TPA: PhaM family polyhydroxyalkanoate granule multifunctional regulatory protein [Acidobacteriota bacterium]|nr:PhaM family polyhydroxyalkanoate granule multifunctional regulatory protein [Acidobacteriota bacterium]
MSDAQDPLEFIKNMWGNMGFTLPGMVTPTLDTNELDKRISELKTVEGWLKTNLGLLQMTIQGLEMQRATLAAMRSMSEPAGQGEATPNPFANAALWQWPFMPQTGDASPPPPPASDAKPERPRTERRKKKSE